MKQEKKMAVAKAVSAIALGTMMIGGVAFGAWGYAKSVNKPALAVPSTIRQTCEDLHIEGGTGNGITLTSSAATFSTETRTITKTLTASVMPANAAKIVKMDWNIAWASGNTWANGKAISNYLAVSPESDGALKASVTCKAKFEGTAVVTATARDTGLTARCTVSFVGIPTDMEIASAAPYNRTKDLYVLGSGENYTFDFNMTNALGEVADSYKENYTAFLGANGSVTVTVYNDAGEVTVGPEKKDYNPEELTDLTNGFSNNTYAWSLEGNKLTVQVKKTFGEQMAEIAANGRTEVKYSDDFYMFIKVTEKTSGISKTFKFTFNDTGVEVVSIDPSTLVF